ncbi:MAG: ABC transporter ATP-binding protein [Bacillota bacterium]
MMRKHVSAVEFRNVSKQFRIYHERRHSLKDLLLFRRNRFESFWVIKEVSFEIPAGSMFGIIGTNGSGKSTLLKMAGRILSPDSGTVITHGRVASLLELGAGFHPEFSGRENVYLYGSILGMSEKEINQRFDQIVSFAELERFIDNPVRTYSSGMYARLGFSVAVHTDPDILLVDEVLSVGDSAFQAKCMRQIDHLRHQGKTIVMVSHDIELVSRICDSVLWLGDGRIMALGDPHEVAGQYRDHIFSVKSLEEPGLNAAPRESAALVTEDENSHAEGGPQANALVSQNRWGDQSVVITGVDLLDAEGRRKAIFATGESLRVRIAFEAHTLVQDPVFGVAFYRFDGIHCYGVNTHIDGLQLGRVTGPGVVEVSFSNLSLLEGTFRLDVAVHHQNGNPFDYITNVLSFQVVCNSAEVGVARLQHRWTWQFSGKQGDSA